VASEPDVPAKSAVTVPISLPPKRPESPSAESAEQPESAEPTAPGDPEVAGPEVADPEVPDPEVAGPEVAGPEVAGPEVAGPEVAGPEVAGSEVADPEVPDPEVAGSEVVSSTIDSIKDGTIKDGPDRDGTTHPDTSPEERFEASTGSDPRKGSNRATTSSSSPVAPDLGTAETVDSKAATSKAPVVEPDTKVVVAEPVTDESATAEPATVEPAAAGPVGTGPEVVQTRAAEPPPLESPPTVPVPVQRSPHTSHRPVRTRPARTRAGSIGVSIVLVAAGLLFTTSAATARGTQLRSERADLADLIEAEDLRVQTRAKRVATLNNQVMGEAAANSANNQAVKSLEESSSTVVTAAGLRAVHGPGLTVTLDDAPRDSTVAANIGPDDLVVHQQDVQAVVNALWAGGAEAMMLQDQRVISTSAVRCVGNTLILQGRVYSPPYRITAVGNVKRLQDSLNSSTYVAYYLQYVASLRLGWSVESSARLDLPAYAGSLTLSHARVVGSDPETSSAGPASSSP